MVTSVFCQIDLDRYEQRRQYHKQKIESEFDFTHSNEGENKPSIELRSGETEEIKITNNNSLSVIEAEPTIAVNPTNPDNIVVAFIDEGAPDSRQSIFYTQDGGDTWVRSEFRQDLLFFDDFANQGVLDRGAADPVLAFDNDGKLYYCWLYTGFKGTEVFVATYWAWSDDGGQTFEVGEELDDRVIAAGTFGQQPDGGFMDRSWIAVDRSGGVYDGTVYIMGAVIFISPADPHPIFGLAFIGGTVVYKAPDSSAFQSDLFNFDNAFLNSEQAQLANMYVNNQGEVHGTFAHLGSGREVENIYHVISSDGSETFSPSTPATTTVNFPLIGDKLVHSRENPMPDAAEHPSSGTIHLVYNSKNDSLLFGQYIKSIDGGQTWSDPQTISDLIGSDFEQMLYPTIAVDDISGRISIAFVGLDASDTGDAYVTSSVDDGLTWDEPCKISSTYSDYAKHPTIFFGDYWESKIVNDKTYFIWADARNGNGSKIYLGIVDHKQSVGISESSAITDKITIDNISPNPTLGNFEVALKVQQPCRVNAKLLDMQGRIITKFKENNVLAGTASIDFELAQNLPSGSYFLLLETPFGNYTRKIILNR